MSAPLLSLAVEIDCYHVTPVEINHDFAKATLYLVISRSRNGINIGQPILNHDSFAENQWNRESGIDPTLILLLRVLQFRNSLWLWVWMDMLKGKY